MRPRKGVTNEMLSNITVKQSTNLQEASRAKQDTTPETGTEFDFLDYLLGLQAQSSNEDGIAATSVDLLNSTNESEEKDVTQDGALALAGLFPGMTVLDTSKPEKTEDGNSIIPADLSNGTDLSMAQFLDAKGAAQGEDAQPVIDENAGKIPDLGVKGLETDQIAGMRAFQSQLAAQEPVENVEIGENDHDKEHSVEGVDLGLSQLGQTFELKPHNGETLTAAGKDNQAAQPTELPQLFSKVESLAKNGGGTMKVTLNPPELGQVEVEVTTRGKQVQVELKSDSSAKAIIESRLGELKASIQSHDLVVSKLEVNIDHELGKQNASMQMMGNWNQQQQQQSQFSQQSRNPFSEFSGNNRMSGRDVTSRATRVEAPVMMPRINHGRVDVRV